MEHRRPLITAPGRPALQIPSNSVAFPLNYIAPPPPTVSTFPRNGVTPPHPHPVAPFPPPPHPHASLHPGPIPPPPPPPLLPPLHPRHQQPFYTIANTSHQSHHLRCHPPVIPTYCPPLLPRQPPKISRIPSTTTSSISSSASHQSSSQIRPRSMPLQPVPIRFPYPTVVHVTCDRCGHRLVVDVMAHHILHPPPRPPRPPGLRTTKSSLPTPITSRDGPLTFPEPPRCNPSVPRPPQLTPAVSRHSHGPPRLWSLPPVGLQASRPPALPLPSITTLHHQFSLSPPPSTDVYRPRPRQSPKLLLKPRNSRAAAAGGGAGGGEGVRSHGIIPYRERRKEISVETHARQQLELEYLLHGKPTIAKMGEMAGRLGVTKDFVRQWFLSKRKEEEDKMFRDGGHGGQEQQQRTLPCGTHNVMEILPSDPLLSDNGVQTVTLQTSN